MSFWSHFTQGLRGLLHIKARATGRSMLKSGITLKKQRLTVGNRVCPIRMRTGLHSKSAGICSSKRAGAHSWMGGCNPEQYFGPCPGRWHAARRDRPGIRRVCGLCREPDNYFFALWNLGARSALMVRDVGTTNGGCHFCLLGSRRAQYEGRSGHHSAIGITGLPIISRSASLPSSSSI